jgi:hypothetical protein
MSTIIVRVCLRARVPAVGLRLRPALHPDRTTVVLAAKLDLDGAAGAAALLGSKRLMHAVLRILGGRDERQTFGARDVVGAEAEQLDERAVRAEEIGVGVFVHVRDRCFLEQVAKLLFRRPHPPLDREPLDLGGRTRREDPEHLDLHGLERHRPAVEHRQVTDGFSGRVRQRHAEIAFDAALDERKVAREQPVDVGGVVAEAAADDVLARGARQLPFAVVDESAVAVEGQGAHARRRVRELGNECELHVDRRRERAHERLQEFLSDRAVGALEDQPEDFELAEACERPRGRARCVVATILTHREPAVFMRRRRRAPSLRESVVQVATQDGTKRGTARFF